MRQGEGAALDSNEGELKKPAAAELAQKEATPTRRRGTGPRGCLLVFSFIFSSRFAFSAAAAQQTIIVVSGRRDAPATL